MSNDQNFADIDLTNATLADLENLDFNAILGKDISEYNLSSNLPDGTYLLHIEKLDRKDTAADTEKEKKARISANLQLKVHRAIQVNDADIDLATLEGRTHFESYNVLSDFGVQGIIKLVLGVVGVSFKDKEAIKQVGSSVFALLNQLISEKVIFGAQVKTVERGGYENCNIVLKEKSFIAMDAAAELL